MRTDHHGGQQDGGVLQALLGARLHRWRMLMLDPSPALFSEGRFGMTSRREGYCTVKVVLAPTVAAAFLVVDDPRLACTG
jgi:hypothetical protein